MTEEIAGTLRRAAGALIDLVVVFGIGFIFGSLFGQAQAAGGRISFQVTGIPGFMAIATMVLYFIGLEARYGQTIGKGLLGMQVTDRQGRIPSWRLATVRNTVRLIDFLPFYIPGFLSMMFSEENRRIGDRIADTRATRI